MNDIGDKLREWRRNEGLTQQQVADLLNKHLNTYAKLERGQTRLNSDYVELLAPILGDSAPLVLGYGAMKNGAATLNESREIERLKSLLEEKDRRIGELEKTVSFLTRENRLLDELKRYYESRIKEEK